MKWSEIMQPVEFMEATRLTILHDAFIPLAVRYAGIHAGMHLLEVGCGTGYFSRYLSKGTEHVHYTGIDIDEGFIKAARPVHGNNQSDYLEGSAYELPFEDDFFDGVISHAFFNCADRPGTAIREMMRVVKPGGRVTTVMPMSLHYETWHTGFYPAECTWAEEIGRFQNKMFKVLHKMGCGVMDFNKGFSASRLPRFFYEAGLKEIGLLPLPKTFSLSDYACPREIKASHVENLYLGEKKKMENIMALTDFLTHVPKEECEDYLRQLKARRDFWMDHLDDNSIWDWFGSSSILVSGVKE